MNIDLTAPIHSVQMMINGFLGRIPELVTGTLVFIAFVFFARFLRRLTKKLSMRYHEHENLGLVLGRIAQLLILALGLFVAITIVVPSVKVNDLVQLLGISSIAIGFAFKDILQNFLAGILILINQPFHLRDQISVAGFEGTVEDIQARATYLRTYDGRRIVIPNSKIFTEAVVVNTAYDHRRSEVMVGIGYGDNIEHAKKIIREAIQKIGEVASDPAPDIITAEIGASSVNLRVRWWSKPHILDVLSAQDKVVGSVKEHLTAAGVDLPYTTQQILFHNQTEPTDGDRRTQREGWPPPPTQGATPLT